MAGRLLLCQCGSKDGYNMIRRVPESGCERRDHDPCCTPEVYCCCPLDRGAWRVDEGLNRWVGGSVRLTMPDHS